MSKYEKKDTRTKLLETLTKTIISKMEQGIVPWHKTWKGQNFPCNFITKKPYRGFNAIHTMITQEMSGYQSHEWMTFKQMIMKGGRLRYNEELSGYEKSTPIVFWDRKLKTRDFINEDKNEYFLICNIYHVWNLDQIEGIERPDYTIETREFTNIEMAESVLENIEPVPVINHSKMPRAYYSSMKDLIHMPDRNTFESEESYYATLFHELGHWSGHESRLKRDTIVNFDGKGTHNYSKEELVAELTSLFICGYTGINSDELMDNSAAYINSWMQNLKKDPNIFFKAASEAQKAFDFLVPDDGLELVNDIEENIDDIKEVA